MRKCKHGLSYAPEYRAWQTMRLRCTEPTNAAEARGEGVARAERDHRPGAGGRKAGSLSGPRVTSGADSEQIVCTPRELLDAVEARFGKMDVDLAAIKENAVAAAWLGPDSIHCAGLDGDSKRAVWEGFQGNLWLNPPFAKLAPWARKCAETPTGHKTRRIFLLVPLCTANWACDYVHGKALVLGLAPRVKFTGHETAFPKDMMIACYGLERIGFEVWRWKGDR